MVVNVEKKEVECFNPQDPQEDSKGSEEYDEGLKV